MLKRLLVLLIVLSFSFVLCADTKNIPITIGSPGWALISEATGEVTELYPFIVVRLDYLSMQPNPDHYKSPIKVTQFKIGLSHKQGTSWENVRSSNYYIVNEILSEGQVKTFSNLDMVIPIDGLNNLKDYWITLQIEIKRDDNRIGYIYAPTKRDIFVSSDVSIWRIVVSRTGEKIMSIIIRIAPFISALAALGIFFFTWLNFKMYKQTQAERSEQQQKFNDLLEAIVVATIVSNPNKGVWEDAKKSFLQGYKGKTQIFKEENKK